MQLFTVKMIARKIISIFDSSGAKTGERVEEIPQVYRDLPHTTALTYQRTFPDNKVEIEAQDGTFVSDAVYTGTRTKPDYTAIRQKVTKRFEKTLSHLAKSEREDDTQRAAQTGDMSAAVNAEMKS